MTIRLTLAVAVCLALCAVPAQAGIISTNTCPAYQYAGSGQSQQPEPCPIEVDKSVDLETADLYDTLTYTITVKNVGDYMLRIRPEYDYNCDGLDTSTFLLDPGESHSITCTAIFDPSRQESDDSYSNTACVTAYDPQVLLEAQEFFGYPVAYKCDGATTTIATHSAAGRVFEDMDADGVQDPGEPGLAGFTVYADLDGDGALDEGEPHAVTGDDGAWSLPVQLGKTTIRQISRDGFTCSYPAGCSYVADLPVNDAPVVVNSRAANPSGLDFGDWRPGSVSGVVSLEGTGPLGGAVVYADLNGNSAQDAGEPATSSAADGFWALTGLKPGGYAFRHTPTDGRTCNAPAGCVNAVTLQSGGSAAGLDFLDAAPPGQLVLPERILPGTARLSGRTGCQSRAFRARVRGGAISTVTWLVDGFTQKIARRPDLGGAFTLVVKPSKLRIGAHRLVAQIAFRTKSRTKGKTLRLSFQRCARQLVAPQFTG